MRKLKLYIETSTWNFVFADDSPEKKKITEEFFALVKKGNYDVYVSEVVTEEISRASEPLQIKLTELVLSCKPRELVVTQEAKELAEGYLNKKIVPEKKEADALHVAVATVYDVDAVVTWNYRHLANLRKAELFHSVNLEMGYFKKVEIITPMEVVSDEV